MDAAQCAPHMLPKCSQLLSQGRHREPAAAAATDRAAATAAAPPTAAACSIRVLLLLLLPAAAQKRSLVKNQRFLPLLNFSSNSFFASCRCGPAGGGGQGMKRGDERSGFTCTLTQMQRHQTACTCTCPLLMPHPVQSLAGSDACLNPAAAPLPGRRVVAAATCISLTSLIRLDASGTLRQLPPSLPSLPPCPPCLRLSFCCCRPPPRPTRRP